MKLYGSLALALAALGCASAPKTAAVAGGSKPAPAPVTLTSAHAAAPAAPVLVPEAPAEPAPLPTECADPSGDVCLPDADFAKRLCGGVFPDVALTLFAKDQPWTHMYMTGDFEAWNASGGKATRARLALDEELVLVARRQRAQSGIIVTGVGASYDALRWDGTCVTIEEHEITAKKPAQPRVAPIPWRRLGESTRVALMSQPKVQASQKVLEKECSTTPDATATAAKAAQNRCDRADAAFDLAIVDFLRHGGTLPPPARRP
jgi:hypothetical protein